MTNIVLCGFMGSGKSSVGRKLAQTLQMEFVDTDQWIEQRQGRRISAIFAQEGEAFFRELEHEACLQLAGRQNLVLSTGGGTLLSPANAEALRRTGIIFLLDAPLAAIRERLKNDKSRPLLQRPDREEAIARLYAERLPLYREAADHIVSAAQPISAVAGEIAACYAGLRGLAPPLQALTFS